MGRMTDWKKNLIRTKNWSGLYTFEAVHGNQLKTTAGRKKIKNNGIYNTYHGSLSQEWIDSDGEILIPALICNVNQSNE